MKIIIIGPVYPWRGGIAHHTALFSKYLIKKHDVSIVTFKRQYPKFLFPGKSQFDPDGNAPEVPTMQWIDSINPFNWISVALKIRKIKPDLIIFAYSLPFFGPSYGIIAAITRAFSNTRIMFLCHNVIPHEYRPGNKVFTKFAFNFSDYFLVQSSSVEKDLLKIKPDARYSVSPHPVYEMFGDGLTKTAARKALNLSEKKTILYFGYIRPYKGLMVLFEAMKFLNDINLIVVGEFYDYKPKYINLVKELNLESRIKIVSDYVPNQMVSKYFSAADVVVLPYLSATQSGIAQIAYHFDKPVIATNVGGLAEIIVENKTGYIVPPDNPQLLARAIKNFYALNKELEFSENVRIEKKKYSWEYFVDNVEKLLNN